MLNDNIDHYIDLNAPDNPGNIWAHPTNHPFSGDSVLSGGARWIKLNLQRYHLCKNDVMIVRSGQIGELSELTADAEADCQACSNDFFYHFDEVVMRRVCVSYR